MKRTRPRVNPKTSLTGTLTNRWVVDAWPGHRVCACGCTLDPGVPDWCVPQPIARRRSRAAGRTATLLKRRSARKSAFQGRFRTGVDAGRWQNAGSIIPERCRLRRFLQA